MIKTSQTSKLLLVTIPITKLLLLATLLSKDLGRDSYIFVVMAFLLDFIVLLTIIATMKKNEGEFHQALPYPLVALFSLMLVLFFIIKSFFPLIEQALFIEDCLYQNLSITAILIPVLFVIFYLAMKRISVFGRLGEFLFFACIFSLVALLLLALPSVKFDELLPVLYNGFSPLVGAVYTLFFFGDYLLLYALMGKIKKDKPYSNIIKYAVIGMVLCIIFFIFYVGIYDSVAFRQIFIISKITKFNSIISSVGRIDWIAFLVLICGILIYISLMIYCASSLFVGVFTKLKRQVIVGIICLILLVGVLIIGRDIEILTAIYKHIFFYYCAFCQYVLPFIIYFCVRRVKNEK